MTTENIYLAATMIPDSVSSSSTPSSSNSVARADQSSNADEFYNLVTRSIYEDQKTALSDLTEETSSATSTDSAAIRLFPMTRRPRHAKVNITIFVRMANDIEKNSPQALDSFLESADSAVKLFDQSDEWIGDPAGALLQTSQKALDGGSDEFLNYVNALMSKSKNGIGEVAIMLGARKPSPGGLWKLQSYSDDAEKMAISQKNLNPLYLDGKGGLKIVRSTKPLEIVTPSSSTNSLKIVDQQAESDVIENDSVEDRFSLEQFMAFLQDFITESRLGRDRDVINTAVRVDSRHPIVFAKWRNAVAASPRPDDSVENRSLDNSDTGEEVS